MIPLDELISNATFTQCPHPGKGIHSPAPTVLDVLTTRPMSIATRRRSTFEHIHGRATGWQMSDQHSFLATIPSTSAVTVVKSSRNPPTGKFALSIFPKGICLASAINQRSSIAPTIFANTSHTLIAVPPGRGTNGLK